MGRFVCLVKQNREDIWGDLRGSKFQKYVIYYDLQRKFKKPLLVGGNCFDFVGGKLKKVGISKNV